MHVKNLLCFAATLWACRREPEVVDASLAVRLAPPDASATQQTRPQLAEHHGLEWFIDSPQAALRTAEQTGKLVLVDLWAPWCHTCMSMREYVLTAANFAELRERLLFLSINTELPENAMWLKRWAVGSWPTLYLVDSAGNVHGRWVGAASPSELTRFVRDGLHAIDATLEGALPKDDPLALALAGDRESAQGQHEAARNHYRAALAKAPSEWPRRVETWVALAAALRQLGEYEACSGLGLDVLKKHSKELGQSASATDFGYLVADCADSLARADARQKDIARALSAKLRGPCEQGSDTLTADDRADACGLLAEQARVLYDGKRERTAYESRLQVLEDASSNVPDSVALTYDWTRAETLLALGRGQEALTFLAARERALPDDYNPPYYLARVDQQLGKLDQALVEVERALGKAYGPRKASMLGLKSKLLLGLGQKELAKSTLEAQLAAYRALPEGQREPERERAIAAMLASW